MRADVVRLYKTVHSWAGIIAGMALFIAFYAGALTVFKDPLTRWATPPAATTFVPLAQTPTLIQKTLSAFPSAAKEFQINLKQDERVPARLEWRELPAGADEHDAAAGQTYVAVLSGDGTVSAARIQRPQLAEFIDVLHRVVGLPFDNDPSRWLMGAIAMLYGLALVSGVVVLVPSLVKDFFALRVGKNRKRMWLDAHNIVGLISLPFHVVMALTAVTFACHDLIYAVQDRMIHEHRLESAREGGKRATAVPHNPARMLTPELLLERVATLAPGFEPERMQYMQVTGPRASVRIWGQDHQALSPRAQGGFVAFDPYSGRVTRADFLPGRQDAANLTLSSFFALHFATFGGVAVKWTYFLLALAGAWLFYSGNLLWIESRRKAVSAAAGEGGPRRSVRMLACATVGVCLGCVCGISLTIVAGKFLHGRVADLAAWHRYVYYSAFFASIGWALLRGPARSAVELPWLAALVTLAIPASSLLGALFPVSGLWAHTSAAALGVDLTAFAGALCLAWLARLAARRARLGGEQTVWSIRPAEARQG